MQAVRVFVVAGAVVTGRSFGYCKLLLVLLWFQHVVVEVLVLEAVGVVLSGSLATSNSIRQILSTKDTHTLSP